MGFVRDHIPGQVAVAAEHRQQVTRGIVVGTLLQLGAAAQRGPVEHDRPGMGEGLVVGVEERHGAHVLLLKGLGGDAGKQGGVVPAHRRGHQRRELLGDHFAALQQLRLQFGLLQPGEVAAQHRCHQADG